MKKLKMITESNYNIELNEDSKKNVYIEGVFASAETKNANNRIYPKKVLQREYDRIMEKVKQNTCLGEIGHPENRSETDLAKAAIMIENLEWQGNDIHGRAKVLSTPYGEIAKSLIRDNVKFGISTRGIGTVNEDGFVNDDFNWISADLVHSASNFSSRFINGILEGVEFPVYNEKEEEKPKSPTDEQIRQALKEHEKNILNFFNSLLNEKDEILNDPLYKKVIDAKTDAERAKALETLTSIRGRNAVNVLINYLKNKK